MEFSTSPYLLKDTSVRRVMTQVLLALVPGIVAYALLIGPGILAQIAIATLTALAAEAAMLRLRDKPLALFLGDGSAVVTAWLVALTFPPVAPWWLTVVGVLFAIVVAKHLYGGLGQNPFNPAMIAFAVCIVSFPALMSQWPGPGSHLAPAQQLDWIFGLAPRLDGMTSATPLDALKTALRADEGHSGPLPFLAGNAQAVIALCYLAGGLFLVWRKVITWHIPTAFLGAMGLLAGLLWLWQPAGFANPVFHLLGGGAMLGAFFIATDPVSGATTPRGKLIFAAGVGLLAYINRVFGGYPDGIAFAVLIMNICVPLIDMYTQPKVFGMKDQ